MNQRIAIVVSTFNTAITSQLAHGTLARLLERDISRDNITVLEVPGAIEIPLVTKLLAQTGSYHAIITLGAVIRGDTSHYDYVCEQVSQGCQRVMLDYDIPVIFGVLTTENEEQAIDRVGGAHGHKGQEAADAALEMINLVQSIKPLERVA